MSDKVRELAKEYAEKRLPQETENTVLWRELLKQAFIAGAIAQQGLSYKSKVSQKC